MSETETIVGGADLLGTLRSNPNTNPALPERLPQPEAPVPKPEADVHHNTAPPPHAESNKRKVKLFVTNFPRAKLGGFSQSCFYSVKFTVTKILVTSLLQ